MRLGYVVVVAAAALISHAGGASTEMGATLINSDCPTSSHSLSTQRFLRIGDAADRDNEERAFNLKAISGLKKIFKPKISAKTLLSWAKKQNPPDDVFVKLELHKAGDKLLDNPDFNVWVAYTRAVIKNNPDDTVLSLLKTRYSENALAGMVGAAKKVSTSTNGATALENALTQKWLASKYSPDDVFNILGLDRAGASMLASPVLNTWTSFMKLFNSKNPKEKTTLIATLTKSYGDYGVVRLLDEARKTKSTAATAKRLEAEQVHQWLRNGDSTDGVFKLLKLDKLGNGLLASPQLATWTKYMNYFNKENPEKTASVIATLTTHYGDEGLSNMLEVAKKIPSTENMATKLQTEQLQQWRSKDEDPGTVFAWLQLDKAGDTLLASPTLTTWLKYSDDLYSTKFKKSITTIDPLRDHYADDVLMKMILTAKKVPSTQIMAKRLEDELFKGWMNFNTPDNVFKLLKLDSAGDKLFETPLWNTYTKFLDEFNNIFPERKITMISALAKSYDEDALSLMLLAAQKVPSTEKLATKLQADQIQYWLVNKEPPDEMFSLLIVDDAVGNIFTNPLLSIWVNYLEAFNAKYPNGKTYMIDSFRTHFGDEALAEMLIAAKTVPSTKTIATSMEKSLLSKWVLAKKSPDEVAAIVNAGTAADDATAKLLQTYAAKFKETYG